MSTVVTREVTELISIPKWAYNLVIENRGSGMVYAPSVCMAALKKPSKHRSGTLLHMNVTNSSNATHKISPMLAYETKAVDDFLTRIPFFKQLPSDIVSALSAAASHVHAHPETTLVRQGTKGNSFYVIISGSVSVHKKDKSQQKDLSESTDVQTEGGDQEEGKTRRNERKEREKETTSNQHLLDIDERYGPCVCVLTAGDSFGLLSLSKETERAASVVTREQTELIMIKKSVYDEYLKEHVNVIESKS